MASPLIAGSSILLIFLLSGWWVVTSATTIHVHNQCGSTVCAKFWVPNVGGGCQELGQTWNVGASPSWVGGTMWAIRGGCAGQPCNTGPPGGVTQFEITVDGGYNLDYYDISVVAGYNIGMKVVPTNGGCPAIDCPDPNNDQCYRPNGPDRTKACAYGTTDYDLYLCQ